MVQLALSTLLVSTLVAVANARSFGFLNVKCEVRTLEFFNVNSTARVLCTTSTGTERMSINLNRCITNSNGRMQWNSQRGNFQPSCKACHLNNDRLTCDSCDAPNGGKIFGSQINLNEGIAFTNDRLVCS